MARHRIAASAATSAATTTATATTAAAAAAMPAKWYWKSSLSRADDDARAWTEYSEKIMAAIEKARKAGLIEVNVSPTHILNFTTMVQYQKSDPSRSRPVKSTRTVEMRSRGSDDDNDDKKNDNDEDDDDDADGKAACDTAGSKKKVKQTHDADDGDASSDADDIARFPNKGEFEKKFGVVFLPCSDVAADSPEGKYVRLPPAMIKSCGSGAEDFIGESGYLECLDDAKTVKYDASVPYGCMLELKVIYPSTGELEDDPSAMHVLDKLKKELAKTEKGKHRFLCISGLMGVGSEYGEMDGYVTSETKFRLVEFTDERMFGKQEGSWYDGQHMKKIAATEAWIAAAGTSDD